MTDGDDQHRPSAEFRASLDREIARAHRAEILFTDRSGRNRRLGMIAGLAAGAVITLTVGLVLGASTSYASAEEVTARQRAATENAIAMSREFAALRMRLARTNYDRVTSAVERGTATSEQLRSAQAELDSARASVRGLDVQFAQVSDTLAMPRPAFAILRGWPLAPAAVACVSPANGRPQEPQVTTLELPAATVKSAENFGVLVNVRELAGGKLLVNDGQNRQVKLLGSDLTGGKIIIDSTRGSTAFNYGGRATSLNPFVADSSIFVNQARIVSVIDGNGTMTRALAMPNVTDPDYMRRTGVDSLSRIIWQSPAGVTRTEANDKPPVVADSAPIVRADLAARHNDTIAFIYRPLYRNDALSTDAPTKHMVLSTWQPDPLREIDEWTVLTDGSLAIVRGHDYHVDLVRPDGKQESGPRLPFDWRRVSNEEKMALIDSALAQRVIAAHNNTLIAGVERSAPGWKIAGAFPDTTDALPSNNIGRFRFLVLPLARPSIEHVFDYYPPVRAGSVFADLDNHAWILPNTSKQSKAGELVYDVVDNKGQLVSRVRLPVGRYIVGFGRGGVVYMASGSIAGGFKVERTRLPSPVGKR